MNNKSLLIHPESKIIDAFSGIRVIAPSNNNSLIQPETNRTIDSIFKLPFNFYFLDKASAILHINEIAANYCSFNSKEDAIGRSMSDVCSKESVKVILEHDQETIRKKELIIVEEYWDRSDNFKVGGISVKLPWYSDREEVIGVFGFTMIGSYTYAYIVHLANRIGLPFLAKKIAQFAAFNPEAKIYGTALTARQAECMYFLIRGKSAKEIGRILTLSSRTIETYLENLKDKLKCQGTAELIEMAIDSGFASFKLPNNKNNNFC